MMKRHYQFIYSGNIETKKTALNLTLINDLTLHTIKTLNTKMFLSLKKDKSEKVKSTCM